MPAFSSPPLLNSHPSQAGASLADYSAMVTFNRSSTTVSTAPHNPFSSLTDANVCVVSVPNGANYLDLYHVWKANGSVITALPTRPRVCVFGEVPIYKGNDHMADPSKNLTGAYDPLVNGFSNWVALPSRSSGSPVFRIDIGESGANYEAVLMGVGGGASVSSTGTSMSTPTEVVVKGVRRIVVTIHAVASFTGGTAPAGIIAGCFGYSLHS
jgi:hypothetical protein